MLDESRSMEGNRWKNAKADAIACAEYLSKQGFAKLSVISFDNNAKLLIDCERVDIKKLTDSIEKFSGGGTNFDKAFILAHK